LSLLMCRVISCATEDRGRAGAAITMASLRHQHPDRPRRALSIPPRMYSPHLRAPRRDAHRSSRGNLRVAVNPREPSVPPIEAARLNFKDRRPEDGQRVAWQSGLEIQRHFSPLIKLCGILRRHVKRVAFCHRTHRAVGVCAPFGVHGRIYEPRRRCERSVGAMNHPDLRAVFFTDGKVCRRRPAFQIGGDEPTRERRVPSCRNRLRGGGLARSGRRRIVLRRARRRGGDYGILPIALRLQWPRRRRLRPGVRRGVNLMTGRPARFDIKEVTETDQPRGRQCEQQPSSHCSPRDQRRKSSNRASWDQQPS
jgi:hypothetical protein